jgi:hypothetical protein
MLDDGFIADREQFFWQKMRQRSEAGTKTCDWNDGFLH